ncbi:hypothetical protein Btru_046721 [Bulinus truncatus]|nr:hypothetical protein Btru_046721 [Bulinus truncatus]
MTSAHPGARWGATGAVDTYSTSSSNQLFRLIRASTCIHSYPYGGSAGNKVLLGPKAGHVVAAELSFSCMWTGRPLPVHTCTFLGPVITSRHRPKLSSLLTLGTLDFTLLPALYLSEGFSQHLCITGHTLIPGGRKDHACQGTPQPPPTFTVLISGTQERGSGGGRGMRTASPPPLPLPAQLSLSNYQWPGGRGSGESNGPLGTIIQHVNSGFLLEQEGC